MKIHLPSGTIHQTDDSAYSNGQYCYRILSGYKAEPIETIVWADWGVYPFVYPVVPDGYKQTINVIESAPGSGTYTYEVVAKTAEDIKAETYIHSITPYQGQTWLETHGLLATVETAIQNIADPSAKKLTQIAWDKAQEWRRDNPFVASLQRMLGKTDDEIHQMFWEASQL